ncbi:MAG: caspase family protein [Desulfobacterales bacterium]|nr:caspase family protein [Desulfobacterales bacterium]
MIRCDALSKELLLLRLLTVLVTIWVMAPKTLAAAVFKTGYSSSYALVVGIDQYTHWPNLEYAAKDAAEMATVLKQKNFQVITLTNQKATRQNIMDQLRVIGQSVDANARFVFYFAGHGQTEDLPGGRERGYLVPSDADTYDWEGTMLPMDRLNHTIKQFKSKHILLAFDSCYSGLGLTRAIKRHPKQDAVYINKMMQTRSIQILTAGSRSEQAIESQGHGLFTDHLLAALNGAADINSDGHITATEIYATLRPSITQQSFSRQTPQFGYIEGNGDMIFYHSPTHKDHATILIDTRVNEIDVWSGNTEIGHRLKIGRHRLPAVAGPTTIMVKKGGQTLYLQKISLPANHVLPILIESTTPVIHQREPFARLTVANRNVGDYSNSMAYDLDMDGKEEFVTASGHTLYVFRADGSVLWKREFSYPVTLDLIDSWQSRPAIALSGMDDSSIHLLLLSSYGQELWHHVRKINHYQQGKPDGDGKIAGLADLDLDGRKEIIAVTTADHAPNSRGIIVYDQHASELWRYLIGPKPLNIVIWENKGGRPDIIIGTYSSADGNQALHNQTHDRKAYLISVTNDGKTNWVKAMGEYYTGIRVRLDNSAHGDRRYVYAYKFTSSKLREDEGGIYKIKRSGKIDQRLDTANSILSMAISSATPFRPKSIDTIDGKMTPFKSYMNAVLSVASLRRKRIYATDRKMNLYKLNKSLQVVQKKQMNSSPSNQEFRVVGAHDYNGDGDKEVLVYSYETLLGNQNPLAAAYRKSKVFYSNMKFQIYSQDLSRLIKSVSLSEGWQKRMGFAVIDLRRPEMVHYPFMVLSDNILVYNY